eukprot:gene2594-3555_t
MVKKIERKTKKQLKKEKKKLQNPNKKVTKTPIIDKQQKKLKYNNKKKPSVKQTPKEVLSKLNQNLNDKKIKEQELTNYLISLQIKNLVEESDKKEAASLLSTLLSYGFFNLEGLKNYNKIFESTQKHCLIKFFSLLEEIYRTKPIADYFDIIDVVTKHFQKLSKEAKLLDEEMPEEQLTAFNSFNFENILKLDSNAQEFVKFLMLLKFFQFKSFFMTSDVVDDLKICFDKIFIQKEFETSNFEVLIDCMMVILSNLTNFLVPIKQILTLFVDKFDEKIWKLFIASFDDSMDSDSEEESGDEEEEEGDEEEEEEEEKPSKKMKRDEKVASKKEEEEDSDDEEEEDDEKSSEEEEDDEESSEEEEEEEEEEEDDEEEEKKKVVNSDEDSDDQGYCSLDDEGMFHTDALLAEVFRQKRVLIKRKENQKKSLTVFTKDVLDLIGHLIKNNSSNNNNIKMFLIDYFIRKIYKSKGSIKKGSKTFTVINKCVNILPELFKKVTQENFRDHTKKALEYIKMLSKFGIKDSNMNDKLKGYKFQKIIFFMKVVDAYGKKEEIQNGIEILENTIFNINSIGPTAHHNFHLISKAVPNWIRPSNFIEKLENSKNRFTQENFLKMITSMLSKGIFKNEEVIRLLNCVMKFTKESDTILKEQNKEKKSERKKITAVNSVINLFTLAFTTFLKKHESSKDLKKFIPKFIDHVKSHEDVWKLESQRVNLLNALGSHIG